MRIKVKIHVNKEQACSRYPDMLVHGIYNETDIFESGNPYGSLTIRLEPPLNKMFYIFPRGVHLTYLGENMWELISYTEDQAPMKKAIRLLTGQEAKF